MFRVGDGHEATRWNYVGRKRQPNLKRFDDAWMMYLPQTCGRIAISNVYSRFFLCGNFSAAGTSSKRRRIFSIGCRFRTQRKIPASGFMTITDPNMATNLSDFFAPCRNA